MTPLDNDIHNARCAINHYYAFHFSDKLAVVVYTVNQTAAFAEIVMTTFGRGKKILRISVLDSRKNAALTWYVKYSTAMNL